jgi:hypothetical protein
VDEVKAIVGTDNVVSQRAAAATLPIVDFAFLRVFGAEQHADVIFRGRIIVRALIRVTLTGNFWRACVIAPERTFPSTCDPASP